MVDCCVKVEGAFGNEEVVGQVGEEGTGLLKPHKYRSEQFGS